VTGSRKLEPFEPRRDWEESIAAGRNGLGHARCSRSRRSSAERSPSRSRSTSATPLWMAAKSLTRPGHNSALPAERSLGAERVKTGHRHSKFETCPA
jgi:hypothetical protein